MTRRDTSRTRTSWRTALIIAVCLILLVTGLAVFARSSLRCLTGAADGEADPGQGLFCRPAAQPTPASTPAVTRTTPPLPTTSATGPTAAMRILGPSRSGLPWHSGAWVGGKYSADGINGMGDWRGRPMDLVTTYAYHDSYGQMTDDTWPITSWAGFQGRLNYSLSPLPTNGEGSWGTIANGEQDDVWTDLAKELVANDRGNSVVRIAWEANLVTWKHSATAKNAGTFKSGWRRIQQTMKAVAPDLVFEFGVNCGDGLTGSEDRLAPLHQLYPGDDVVDLVGCDTYDWYRTHASSESTWPEVLHPPSGPGIQDVVDFARAHRKGASFGEWGLARNDGSNGGGGDNPFYLQKMFDFFSHNADVVAFECYFNEPQRSIKNSVYGGNQNPRASRTYRKLW